MVCGPGYPDFVPRKSPPESRLAAAALTVGVLAVLGFTCLVGGFIAQDRVIEAEPTEATALVEPPAYREDGPYLLVCPADPENFTARNEGVNYNQRIENERVYEECLGQDADDDADNPGFHDLPAALDAAEPGTRVLLLPGQYDLDRTALVPEALTDLQIEGLGDGPEDVLLSGGFALDHVLEAKGAKGLYLKDFTLGQARIAGLELDGATGAAVDAVAAFQSGGHGLHIDSSQGVLLTGCRAEAADTAGITVEDAAVTIDGCEATGNTAGLVVSGQGTTAQITGNRLHANGTGLVIAYTGTSSDITATGNLAYANNTEPYEGLGTAACEADLAERDWTEGLVCPNRTYPSGVGILVADATGVQIIENRLWDQRTTAIATWGVPGVAGGGGDQNRFQDNVFGIREDGQHQRNRLDLWWDGTGTGDCFAEPNLYRTAPAVLPDCEEGAEASRLYGDPLRTLKAAHCGIGDAATLPTGCDWLGARFTDRLEFQAAVVFAAALLFLTGAGWLGAARSDNPPRAGQMTFSAIATGFGAFLLLLAAWSGRADYEALAIGLWGFGWVLAGRSWYRCGVRGFGSFTAVIGWLAIADGIDRGVWTIAPLPVAPAWLWLVMLPLWTLLALVAAFGARPRELERPHVERTPVTAPTHDRWDW